MHCVNLIKRVYFDMQSGFSKTRLLFADEQPGPAGIEISDLRTVKVLQIRVTMSPGPQTGRMNSLQIKFIKLKFKLNCLVNIGETGRPRYTCK